MKLINKQDSKFTVELDSRELHYIERAVDLLRQAQETHVYNLLRVSAALSVYDMDNSDLKEIIEIQANYLGEIGKLAEEITAIIRPKEEADA